MSVRNADKIFYLRWLAKLHTAGYAVDIFEKGYIGKVAVSHKYTAPTKVHNDDEFFSALPTLDPKLMKRMGRTKDRKELLQMRYEQLQRLIE